MSSLQNNNIITITDNELDQR